MKTEDIVSRLADSRVYSTGPEALLVHEAITEISKLRSMLQWCAEETWEGGDIDWGYFQDEMVKAGFFVEVPASEEFREEWESDTMYVLSWSPLAGEQK